MPARDRPVKGQAVRPHLLCKSKDNFPVWYKELCGEVPKIPNGLALKNICNMGEKENDKKCARRARSHLQNEQSKVCPVHQASDVHRNECIDPKDMSNITNPFAKHNRKVFQMAAQNLHANIWPRTSCRLFNKN